MTLCSKCAFWKPHTNATNPEYNGTTGECRINPPVVLFATQQEIQGAQYPETYWPTTGPEDWCGKGTTVATNG